jgi:1-acyl-sn-glycerol-3-phosphate acyltransferase
MANPSYSLPYPRKRIARFFIRLIFRFLLRVLFRIEISGKENSPRKGPLLVVGNHTGAMEVILLNGYFPLQIEMMSAADTPVEKITEIISNLYGSIPLRRGSYDRAALNKALDVLKQDGVIGLFTEGGIWEEGKQKALPGISWLSYRSSAPLIPIGFNNTTGALNAALKFKRPLLSMKIGRVLPAAKLPQGMPKKNYFQEHASKIMEAVYALVPAEDISSKTEIIDEWFEIELNLKDKTGKTLELPIELQFQQASPLAKFLHRPAILDIFETNLELPVNSLQNLKEEPPVSELIQALQLVLHYLEEENPYLLTYRFGIKGGLAMQQGLGELLRILEWCFRNDHKITITPVRHYYSPKEEREIVERDQDIYLPWM